MTMYAGPMVSSGEAYPLRQHDRQEKQFIDTTGAFWQNGELEDKAMGVFQHRHYPRWTGDNDHHQPRSSSPPRVGLCKARLTGSARRS